ncbi:MAG: DNA-directed RNA polymerase subunit delta [Bacillota bacterium]
MIDIKEESLVNLAEKILKDAQEPIDLYELFEKAATSKGLNETDVSMINRFYSELVSSAKFVYTGENTWDLKNHQKIELWDKDGSYYNEYKEVHDEDLDEKILKEKEAEKAHQAMLERRLKAEEEAEKAAEEAQQQAEAKVVAEEETPEEPVEAVKEEEVIEEVEPTLHEDFGKLEEEDLEEEDLDEEEYEKYMDEYEDMYDDE